MKEHTKCNLKAAEEGLGSNQKIEENVGLKSGRQNYRMLEEINRKLTSDIVTTQPKKINNFTN